jgi:hypothetical protein
MAIIVGYYINGSDLSSATGIFANPELTECAPDGWYSDGVVTRQFLNCELLPIQPCPSCSTGCGDFDISNNKANDGRYLIDWDTGTALGAIVVRINQNIETVGVLTSLGAVEYASVSSQNYGYISSGSANFLFIGSVATSCLPPIPFTYTVPDFNYLGGAFVNTGNTFISSVDPDQDGRTPLAPGECVMVIPKTSNAFTSLKTYFTYTNVCSIASFSVSAECPKMLPTWMGSANGEDAGTACLLAPSTTYYYVHVNGSGGVLGLYDFVFKDPYGETALAPGFYNTGSMSPLFSYIEVGNGGTVISFGTCAPPQFYLVEMCFTKVSKIISAPEGLPDVTITVVEYPGCLWKIIETSAGPANATFGGIAPDADCQDQCALYSVSNTTEEEISFEIIPCSTGEPDPLTIKIPPTSSINLCFQDYSSTIPEGIEVDFVSCACSANEYLVESCLDPGLFVLVKSQTPLQQNNHVQLSGFPGCWWRVVDEDKGFAVFVVNQINTDPNFSCSDVCGYYKLTNGGGDLQSVSYVDCAGSPINISIAPSTSIFVCAKASSFVGEGISVELLGCSCAPGTSNYMIKRCNDTAYEIVSTPLPLTIGSLIVTNEHPGCVWEVMSSTNMAASASFASTASSCNQQCATFSLLNNDDDPALVEYIDCEGFSQTVSVLGGSSMSICARSIASAPFDLLYQVIGCNCVP